ncbi:hypothetical protein [Anaeromassilibacillus senegalensis]|uniref:Uncharacterized protein n=1 Tax=Anaeromassilibacillus senegalensis TaxID=1673717 RepID=A0ABS9CIW1_9FIRM|nr:hypothetical protein [Anaeromassilibacillus senegalensis]MCF2651081.1 hypothetical protein [Anaeromassilibacillus senegalensis]
MDDRHLGSSSNAFYPAEFDVTGEPVQVTVSGSAAKDYRFLCLTMNDCL